jgi:dTDP-4-dehydrorhamnose 3,5-epimerase-like enzyme
MPDQATLVTEFFGGLAKRMPCRACADARGTLLPFPFDTMAFAPTRVFAVTRVPAGTVRGGHAHRSGHQWLVCLNGSIELLMRCHGEEATVLMDSERFGMLLGPGVWCQQKYRVEGSVLLVLASEPYDPASYVEQWT